MNSPPLTPPIKCQGIKTKLVDEIRTLLCDKQYDRWVEPFCGSCVVPLNVQPTRALLCDSNTHIIKFYRDIQNCTITPTSVRDFLREEGAKLSEKGQEHFYEVRERFNNMPSSLDFIFLNRSCFNGVMRFNRKGRFNVPFCHKPDRFATAYITKISNQVAAIRAVISRTDWEFRVADFKEVLTGVTGNDLVYADPPYAGRHVDYFNGWSADDETDLSRMLADVPCNFILSTWHSNKFRSNTAIEERWAKEPFHTFTKQHFYHVGSSEDLRHPMMEALVTNFTAKQYASFKAPEQIGLPITSP